MTKEKGILLHPDKGLNPHMTSCWRCGNNTNEILLLGEKNKIYKCQRCDMHHIGRPKKGICTRCKSSTIEFLRELEDMERIPSGYCADCQKELDEYQQIVAEGGVHFRCRNCQSVGVIKKSKFADAVRERAGVMAPDPVGVEFSLEDPCPKCRG